MNTFIYKCKIKDRELYYEELSNTYSCRFLFKTSLFEFFLISYSPDFFKVPECMEVLSPMDFISCADNLLSSHDFILKNNKIYYPLKSKNMGRFGRSNLSFQNKKRNIQFRPE